MSDCRFPPRKGKIEDDECQDSAGRACRPSGDCVCGEVPEEGLLPFAAGSYYYSDKLQVGTTSVSIKRGGGIDIDAQQ